MSQPKETVRKSAYAIVDQLRERAKADPVFSAVCHRFAIRERARAQVTIASLRLTLGREGFHYPTAKYASVLTFLAGLGIGTLKTSGGKVEALVDIKITLQSIGLAAIAKADQLDAFTVGNTFDALPQPAPSKPVAAAKPVGYKATLNVTVDGKVMNFALPKLISPDELGILLAGFYANATGEEKGRA